MSSVLCWMCGGSGCHVSGSDVRYATCVPCRGTGLMERRYVKLIERDATTMGAQWRDAVNRIERLMALDLELNQPSEKIIQVGACAFEVRTGEILDRFCVTVNPDGEEVAPIIEELTGITSEMAWGGIGLAEAYSKLVAFHAENRCAMNPVTWGGGDSILLRDQLEAKGQRVQWAFGRRWIDAKTVMQTLRMAHGINSQGGLARSMTKLGLNFVGRKHNAGDDAYNTALIYIRLMEMMRGLQLVKT